MNRRRITGAAVAVAAGLMLVFSFCIGGVDIWIADSPFWPGLDRPPAHSDKLEAMAARGPTIVGVWIADVLLLGCLLLMGVVFARGQRVPLALIVAWGLGRISTAMMRAALTYSVMNAQIAGMPDPEMPQYSAASVQSLTITGLAGLLMMRFMFAVVMAGGLVYASRVRVGMHPKSITLESRE